MAQDTPTITAEPRERVGSRYSQRLRQNGRLPAVIYGHKTDPVAVSVGEEETLHHLHQGTIVMNVNIDGVGTETCLVKDLQFGFMGDDVIHVDFARVNLDQTVTVNVGLNYHGTLTGSAEAGAIVVTDLTEIEVTCTVRNIPDAIRVDLGNFEESVTIGDVELPENVTPTLGPETTIAHIVFQAEEEEEVATTEGAAEGEAAPDAGAAPDAPAEGSSDSSESS